MDRQAAATLPGRPASVAVARRFVRITAAMWRLSADTVDEVELCMSELVSNAVTHTASRRVHCRLWSARGVLFLEVDDEGPRELPRPGPAARTTSTDAGWSWWRPSPRPGAASPGPGRRKDGVGRAAAAAGLSPAAGRPGAPAPCCSGVTPPVSAAAASGWRRP
ncbi:ATP-binding protein [Streptacidiphilus sp. 4-A2]|nr:ATP-binding protein [Streptacidiphilus sp. 4-A2]